jgi:hypothetical protein
LYPNYVSSPLLPSRMRHTLGNFEVTAPLPEEGIGPPTQIAYYSSFAGPKKYDDKYQSCEALRSYSRPDPLFSITDPYDKRTWAEKFKHPDSLPQPGIEPVIAACKEAKYDLRGADVIARRGAIVRYPLFPRLTNSELTAFVLAWRWARRIHTLFLMSMGSCVFFANPSIVERNLALSPSTNHTPISSSLLTYP